LEYLFHGRPKHRIQLVKGTEAFVRPPPPSLIVNHLAEVLLLRSSFGSWDDIREEPHKMHIISFIWPKVGNEFLKEIRRR
jgi:hypothetical protein